MTNVKPMQVPVRYFRWDEDAIHCDNCCEAGDFVECDENEFENAEGAIEYERNTVHANGVSQICLTKNPFKG